MQGLLFADVCNLNCFLLNNTSVAFLLYRSAASFVIGAKDAAQGYKILFDEIYMRVAYVEPSPRVLMGVSRALEQGHQAMYPFTRTECCTFNVPQYYQDIYLDNIFQDIVPYMIIVGFLDNQAKNATTSSHMM